ncbi:MAG: hypothetical protein ABI554_09340 [Flavobacterium sp.]
MSKIVCNCGNIILDQTDDLIYKASFIRDQNIENISKRNLDLAEFIKAIKNNDRIKWLEKYFGDSIYNKLNDEEIINDILLKCEASYESIIYNCDKCGRIMVEKDKNNNFVSFLPEKDNWKDIFKGLSE